MLPPCTFVQDLREHGVTVAVWRCPPSKLVTCHGIACVVKLSVVYFPSLTVHGQNASTCPSSVPMLSLHHLRALPLNHVVGTHAGHDGQDGPQGPRGNDGQNGQQGPQGVGRSCVRYYIINAY